MRLTPAERALAKAKITRVLAENGVDVDTPNRAQRRRLERAARRERRAETKRTAP